MEFVISIHAFSFLAALFLTIMACFSYDPNSTGWEKFAKFTMFVTLIWIVSGLILLIMD